MSKKKQKKVPEIRFSGFNDDWEQRKLGDHCEMFNGDRSSKYPNAQDMVSDGIPFINAGDLENGHVNLKTAKKISREKYDELSGAKLQLGDIVYCLRGTLGKNAYIDNFDKGTVASSLVAIRPKNIDGRYLYYILNSDIEYKQRIVHDEGAAQPNLSAKSVSEFVMPVPDIDEQKKISAYFSNLDHLIALHQCKIEALKQMKKGFLQQLFPATGENVPKVRFAGFKEEWEQRKLGEVLEERNDQISENTEYRLMSFVQGRGVVPKGDRYDRSFLVKDDKKKYKKTELGDFIYSSNNLETGSIGFNRTGKALISPVYSIFKSKSELESQFIGILSKRKDFIAKMIRFRQGVVYGQWRIHESDFLNINIEISKYEEQKAIVNFFKQLDSTIALHQNKLDQLNKLKTAFLQNMFI